MRDRFGVTFGSTVALYIPNHVDYAPTVFGTSLCGAKVTPVNPRYTSSELEKVLERSRSSVLVAHTSTLDVALEAAKACPTVQNIIVMADNGEPIPEGTHCFADILKEGKPFAVTTSEVSNETPVSLPYSSGTTGLPKGVCLSHSNLVANLLQYDQAESDTFLPDDKLISPLPFFHIYAFTVSLLYPAWKGQTVITTSGRFELPSFCAMVQEHQPSRSHLVPPILLGLAQHPIVDQYDMSSLQSITSAAAPLSVAMADKVTERIGATVKEAWGMSELSPIGTINHDKTMKKGSVGQLASSTFGKIMDEEGNSLAANEPGELLIKGPQVMMGYMDEPEKTAECLSSTGWLRTGDIAMFDEDGYCFITDRIKELIKVRGFQVAPAELEALLLKHEGIQDVAVIGVPDDASGELPRAYIVLKQGQTMLTADEVMEWMHPQVAAYKRLHGGVIFVDEIPKSASGKILRRILRDQVKSEMKL